MKRLKTKVNERKAQIKQITRGYPLMCLDIFHKREKNEMKISFMWEREIMTTFLRRNINIVKTKNNIPVSKNNVTMIRTIFSIKSVCR